MDYIVNLRAIAFLSIAPNADQLSNFGAFDRSKLLSFFNAKDFTRIPLPGVGPLNNGSFGIPVDNAMIFNTKDNKASVTIAQNRIDVQTILSNSNGPFSDHNYKEDSAFAIALLDNIVKRTEVKTFRIAIVCDLFEQDKADSPLRKMLLNSRLFSGDSFQELSLSFNEPSMGKDGQMPSNCVVMINQANLQRASNVSEVLQGLLMRVDANTRNNNPTILIDPLDIRSILERYSAKVLEKVHAIDD